MFSIKDKSEDNWGGLDYTKKDHHVLYEDGSKEPLTTEHVIFTHGKYKDLTLSNCTDVSYLTWIKTNAVEKGDVFSKNCATMRLLEIKNK